MSPAGADPLPAMTAIERKAHRLLAAELAVSDDALARLITRARSADAFLCGRAGGSVAPAADGSCAKVIDLTAYRLDRAQRAAVVGR